MRRFLTIALVLGCVGLIAGCGSEAPAPGELTVTSDPAGAAIVLDGQASGHVTPYTFEDLEGGTTYEVSVSIEGWASIPGERMVDVPFGSSASAAFTLSQTIGSLAVTSAPAGARIFLDGADTDKVTPFTFELVPGDYVVTVALPNHVSFPAEITATVADAGTTDADFTLTLENVPRIVLLEGFSNVYCVGCPAMTANVDFVLHEPGYGPERLVFLKWPAILSPLDPFYWVTTTITNDRVSWYFGASSINLPSLVGDGSLLGGLGTPVNANGIMGFVDDQPEFADVLVTVATDEDLTDIGDLEHDATVTLLSPGGIDLSGYELNVVLVYDEVETENEGYIEGITEYHWIMRDHVVPSSDIGALTAGESYPFDITLTDPLGGELAGHAVYPHAKEIIAWVQNSTSRDVIQAGSTIAAKALQASVSAHSNPDTPAVHSGGSR